MENIGLLLYIGLFLVGLEHPINIDRIFIKWNQVIFEKYIV